MVFVDANDGSGLSEALEHPVGPATVAVLQMLDDLKIQIHVHLFWIESLSGEVFFHYSTANVKMAVFLKTSAITQIDTPPKSYSWSHLQHEADAK